MAKPIGKKRFNIVVVGQAGRLQWEALIFLASMRHFMKGFNGRLFIAEPQPGPRWPGNPTIADEDLRAFMTELGATFVPFQNRHFGKDYPYGNKIEALLALPKDEPFVFFDTDTLITADLREIPFDFKRPTASLRREGTWPKLQLYGPGYAGIWKSLYDRFGLDFESSLDLSQPDEFWRRYLYFNAGFFFYQCPRKFGQRFLDYALAIRKDPPPELVCQTLDPWLDQVALPLVIHSLGGGRDTLPPGMIDGSHTCHYRLLPMLYAREDDHVVEAVERATAPNKIKKRLKRHEPALRMIYQKRGHKVRQLFDQNDLPVREQAIRNRIKRAGFWMR